MPSLDDFKTISKANRAILGGPMSHRKLCKLKMREKYSRNSSQNKVNTGYLYISPEFLHDIACLDLVLQWVNEQYCNGLISARCQVPIKLLLSFSFLQQDSGRKYN